MLLIELVLPQHLEMAKEPLKPDGTIISTGQNAGGMYLLETINDIPNKPLAMSSLSQLTSLEQWHQRLTHCNPLIIQGMAKSNLVDGLKLSNETINGKCEDCILGQQTQHPFDGTTEKDLDPLDFVVFDLWGPSCIQSAGGKSYLMVIVNSGSSNKHSAYMSDKSDTTTIAAFDNFCTKAEAITGRKV